MLRRRQQAKNLREEAPAVEEDQQRQESAAHVKTVLEQQGPGRIIHRPDGSIVWEPLPEGAPAGDCSIAKAVVGKLLGMLEVTAAVVLATSGVVAAVSSWQHVEKAYTHGMELTSRQLTCHVTHTVASTVAGLIAGTVLGPVRAATSLVRKVTGPALGALAIHRGVIWAKRQLVGVGNLLRRLRSGDLLKQLDALRSILARALASEKFRQEFARFAGIEQLLKMVSDAVDAAAQAGAVPGLLPPGLSGGGGRELGWSPLMQLLTQALEALLRSQECRVACIHAGGVPVLLKLLAHSSAVTTSSGKAVAASSSSAHAALLASAGAAGCSRLRKATSSSTVSSYDSSCELFSLGASASQDPSKRVSGGGARVAAAGADKGGGSGGDKGGPAAVALVCLSRLAAHAAARDAIRDAGGLPILVGLVAQQSTLGPHAGRAIKLLQAIATDSSAKDAIGQAGGVQALLTAVRLAPPSSQVQTDAAVTLHKLLRGSPNNQLALAHAAGSFAQLQAAHAALGGSWQPCKAELQAVMTVLSRFPEGLPCHSLPHPSTPVDDCASPFAACMPATDGGDSPVAGASHRVAEEGPSARRGGSVGSVASSIASGVMVEDSNLDRGA